MSITSDSLEYDKETGFYHAKGSVKITQENITVQANEIKYDEKESMIYAEGNVSYETPEIRLKAEKAEVNMDTKKGVFYNAEFFSKKDSSRVSGKEIIKKSDNEYFLKDASITTCDSDPPDWCFKGNNVEVIIGDRLKANSATFNINNTPVFYTPYLWAPVVTERTSGLLTPVVGYGGKKGLSYRQPYFWAIDDNKDATVVLDYYSKRGFGEGLEYRYLGLGGIEGNHWLYHIRDNYLLKDFYELKSSHEIRNESGFSAYWNLHLLNKKDFYAEYNNSIEYNKIREDRITRFTQSAGEISYSDEISRIYIMSQYYQDLNTESTNASVVQRLPEVGFVLNPQKIGPLLFSLTSSVANFARDEGPRGERIDIYPKLSHSFGDKVVIFQNLGLRETAYSLTHNESEGYKDLISREFFDYNVTGTSRITKQYSTFTHAIEPSLGYTFSPKLNREKTNLPLFDSTEQYTKQSTTALSITNRLFDKDGEFFTMTISESYNSYITDKPFSPINVAVSLGRPISLRGDASYNTYTGDFDTLNSSASVNVTKALTISFGERYNKIEDILSYNMGINYSISKNLSTDTTLWYDARRGGLRDFAMKMRYQKQCWGITVSFNKKPGDYGMSITFDLLGVGSSKKYPGAKEDNSSKENPGGKNGA
ncbi:MAG: hypothetical protein LLF28_00480 [Nitrospiraceae bacterium]|nr:hypothetical protein [Nitrospiraceae bacterium]